MSKRRSNDTLSTAASVSGGGGRAAPPSWLAARLRLLALGLALLGPVGLHRACVWKARGVGPWPAGSAGPSLSTRSCSGLPRAFGPPLTRWARAGTRAAPAVVSTWHGTFRLEENRIHLVPLLLLQLRLSRHLDSLRRVRRANGEPRQRALMVSEGGRASCGGRCSLVPGRQAC